NNDVKWSEELYLIYGLDKEAGITPELIAKHIYPEDAASLNEKIKQLYEKGGSFTQEYRIRNTNGETRMLADKAYIEKDSTGRTVIKGISQDITERKKAEAELAHREEILREAQNIAHLGSWEWDTANNEVIWSEEMYRLFG